MPISRLSALHGDFDSGSRKPFPGPEDILDMPDFWRTTDARAGRPSSELDSENRILLPTSTAREALAGVRRPTGYAGFC